VGPAVFSNRARSRRLAAPNRTSAVASSHSQMTRKTASGSAHSAWSRSGVPVNELRIRRPSWSVSGATLAPAVILRSFDFVSRRSPDRLLPVCCTASPASRRIETDHQAKLSVGLYHMISVTHTPARVPTRPPSAFGGERGRRADRHVVSDCGHHRFACALHCAWFLWSAPCPPRGGPKGRPSLQQKETQGNFFFVLASNQKDPRCACERPGGV
jgi:hypothetical protein